MEEQVSVPIDQLLTGMSSLKGPDGTGRIVESEKDFSNMFRMQRNAGLHTVMMNGMT